MRINLNEKRNVKFMGEEFEIDAYSINGDFLVILTGLMVCGKEYYDLMKSMQCEIGNDKLWKLIL